MDVRSIQEALRKAGFDPGLIDGIAGARTKAAIQAFQKANGLKVDGIAGPVTLGALFPKSAVPPLMEPVENGTLLTMARLKRMWPTAKTPILSGVVASAGIALPLHGITSKNRLCHFMAQVSHECGGGTIYEENLNYSAGRIAQVFRKYFKGISTAPYAMNARALGNRVYGGRMGNRPGTSDGYDYRGRGLIQITGRDGYRNVGKIAGLRLEADPALAIEPQNLLPIACAFWTWKDLNAVVDGTRSVKGYARGSIEAVTKIVNGGQNGIDDRRHWFAKWKRELGL